MAILCRDHKLLFIQAPRTGSSAVGKILRERLGGEWLPPEPIVDQNGSLEVNRQHARLGQLLDYGFLTEEEIKSLFIFSTVRNPYDSLVSAYVKDGQRLSSRLNKPDSWIHRRPGRAQVVEYAASHSFRRWIVWRFGKRAALNFAKRKMGSMYAKHARGTNALIRFENLQEDLSRVLRRAGIKEDLEIPRHNITTQKDKNYREYYDTLSRLVVYYRFRGDFETYGYEF